MPTMKAAVLPLPDDVAALKALVVSMSADLAAARARASATEALVAHLEELEASANEDELAAEMAAAKTTNVTAFERRRPARKPFPEHLPRERVVIPAPCSCPACGGTRLSKLGEDVTE